MDVTSTRVLKLFMKIIIPYKFTLKKFYAWSFFHLLFIIRQCFYKNKFYAKHLPETKIKAGENSLYSNLTHERDAAVPIAAVIAGVYHENSRNPLCEWVPFRN